MEIEIFNDELNNSHELGTYASTTHSLSAYEMPFDSAEGMEKYIDEYLAIPKLLMPKFSILKLPLPPKTNPLIDLIDDGADGISDASSINAMDAPEEDVSVAHGFNKLPSLYKELKKRFTGRRGNHMIMELIDIAELDDQSANPTTPTTSVMINELERLLGFSRKRNMRVRVSSQFNLLATLELSNDNKETSPFINEVQAQIQDISNYTSMNRARAITRYLKKKSRRNNSEVVRYDVRRAIANNRTRAKGKFTKKERVNLVDIVKNLVVE